MPLGGPLSLELGTRHRGTHLEDSFSPPRVQPRAHWMAHMEPTSSRQLSDLHKTRTITVQDPRVRR